MASITIRNLDDDLKARLRVQAARHGRSMEDEVRVILRRAVTLPSQGAGDSRALLARIRKRVDEMGGGIDLPIPPRDPMRDPPAFD